MCKLKRERATKQTNIRSYENCHIHRDEKHLTTNGYDEIYVFVLCENCVKMYVKLTNLDQFESNKKHS